MKKKIERETSKFKLEFTDGLLSSIKSDGSNTEFIWPGELLGQVDISFRNADGKWKDSALYNINKKVLLSKNNESNFIECKNKYSDKTIPFKAEVSFLLSDDELIFKISIENNTDNEIEIGKIAIPLPMNSNFDWGKKADESVLRHHFISGSNSYIYWMRLNSEPPHLIMTPLEGTSLEYFDLQPEEHIEKSRIFNVYIHSETEKQKVSERGGKWRQNHSSCTLQPKGMEKSKAEYAFKLQWVDDFKSIRETIVNEGMIDIDVLPGMTVVCDTKVLLSLKTKECVEKLESEYPYDTIIKEKLISGECSIYEISFSKLGENYIKVFYSGKTMMLEFFVTEPVETLIEKRAKFIVKHQICDTSKWYNGLLCEWNMETQTLLTPDNYDRIKGWRIYEVTCDDPGLSKPSFLAEKNSRFPNQEEVSALDCYIDNFVWGGLQRTDEEEFPYGIYGIPDWKTNRESEDIGVKGQSHLWRIYDYPHIALMYFRMYQIALFFPQIKMTHSKQVYLERAYRTAVNMFTLPLELDDWSAYKTGLYNELVIPEIIDALSENGEHGKALRLKRHWRKKVKYFTSECEDLFGSEYPYDSTGFESTHAFAKYAVEKALANEEYEDRQDKTVTKEEALVFMEKQIEANLMCRGWVEPAYYLLGSDYRGDAGASYTLSYMAQMGGWALWDYAVNYSKNPQDYMRIAYASFMSSWALMNTGTEDTDYGYWFGGKENDGGAGGGFEPAPYGKTWLDQEHHRGSWYYSCEIDLGFSGAMRYLSVVFSDDPIFGKYCYGGIFTENEEKLEIIPEDNSRQYAAVLKDDIRFLIELKAASFLKDQPIVFENDKVLFTLSCPNGGANAQISINSFSDSRYNLTVEDKHKTEMEDGKASMRLTKQTTKVVLTKRSNNEVGL